MPWYDPSNTTSGTSNKGLSNIDWAQKAKESTPSITNMPTVENWATSLQEIRFGDNAGFLTYSSNGVDAPVLLLGDTSGSVLRETNADGTNIFVGSPVTLDGMINKLRSSYGSQQNKVTQLKQQLAGLGYYGTTKEAQASLAYGDIWDNSLTSAVASALWTASAYNYDSALKDPTKKSFTSFEDFLSSGKRNPNLIGGGAGGGGTRTSIVKQQFESADYDIAVDELFQRTVGRGASKEELDYFVSQLQSYANANPQKTVTTQSGDTTTSVTTGGVSSQRAESMLRETALNTPGAEEYNKATKYLDFFTEALSSPVRLV